MAKINGIPVYDALVVDPDDGILKISLVDDPAVMSNFQSFDSHSKMQMYKVADEEQRLVRGVVMRADFPIYRRDKNGEYYIIYKADTIRQMAEKYLLEGRQNEVNTMHEANSDVDGVQMVQWFIKDSDKGIVPAGFDDIADGSLFAEFHIVNDDVWNAIKEGTYRGFSLEGLFNLIPDDDQESVKEIVDSLDGAFSRLNKYLKNTNQMSKMDGIMTLLARYLAKYGSVTTDKGVLSWSGSEDLKAGDAVSVVDADGNSEVAADGDYTTADGKVIKVAEGKVTEIVDADAQVADTFGSKATDKGELHWDGEGDLEAGAEVFILNEEGERVAAPDGDYKTEDGKVIKVVDGKVAEILDDEAEVGNEDAEFVRFSKKKEAFATFSEIFDAIRSALAESGLVDFYVVDAAEDYAIVSEWDGESEHLYKYAITVDGDSVSLGAKEEVKIAYVPVAAPEPNATAKENEELRSQVSDKDKEIAKLSAQLDELKKKPAAKGLHETYRSQGASKTGDRGKDLLASYFEK